MSPVRRGLPSVAGVWTPTDKRFRRPDVRPDRRRRAGRAVVRAIAKLLPVVMIAGGGAWLGSAALNSRFLRVEHLVIRGNARLSAESVAALVSDMRGQNILRLDVEKYRRLVLGSPWAADVSLARVLPSTVEIHVTERTPMAIARVGQQLYLVDAAGVVLAEYTPALRDVDAPLVDGLVSAPVAAGATTSPARARLTDTLLRSLDSRPELMRRVSQIDVSNAHDALVMLDDKPTWLHLGEGQFVERLGTYFELAPALADRFSDLDYVDLRFDTRVFVHARTPRKREAPAAR